MKRYSKRAINLIIWINKLTLNTCKRFLRLLQTPSLVHYSKPQSWVRLPTWLLSRRPSLTPSSKRVSEERNFWANRLFPECCIKAPQWEVCGKEKVWQKTLHNQKRWPDPEKDCGEGPIPDLGGPAEAVDWVWSRNIQSHRAQACAGNGLQVPHSPGQATFEPETAAEAPDLGCREAALDFRHFGISFSPVFLQTLAPWFPNDMLKSFMDMKISFFSTTHGTCPQCQNHW